uniref:Short-chain dehydrogenase/reductase family 16C member 6 n=1 Tax=Sus scrofa TaxID=9823 RepID=A0A8D1WBF0_PIG
MNMILDTTVFWGKFLYYFLESLFFKIIPKKKKDVSGEIVLITGASSGLGRLMAIELASLGAILVLWDINEENNMETCRLVKEKGAVKAFAYKCDCSHRQEVYRVAKQVKRDVGDVTILINNTGVITGKQFLDTPDHMVERTFHTNALSHFWTCKAVLPSMLKSNHGHLVCITSIAGLFGVSGLSHYSASKFAAFGLAESLNLELSLQQKSKIKTTIVCPYFINTGMFDGCTIKYPFLWPMLEQEYVQIYLIMPQCFCVLLLFKQTLAPKMMIALAEYLGMETFMASFRGRKKAEEAQTEAEKRCLVAEASDVLMK